jgi:hypothetical protein
MTHRHTAPSNIKHLRDNAERRTSASYKAWRYASNTNKLARSLVYIMDNSRAFRSQHTRSTSLDTGRTHRTGSVATTSPAAPPVPPRARAPHSSEVGGVNDSTPIHSTILDFPKGTYVSREYLDDHQPLATSCGYSAAFLQGCDPASDR